MKTAFNTIAISLLVLLPACPAAAQVPDQLKYSLLPPSAGAQGIYQFGLSVATGGGYVVVGAPYDDTLAMDAGVADVFDATNGALLFALTKPGAMAQDYFGDAVAISGSLVVIGAHRDDAGATDAVIAYVYDLAGATPALPVIGLHDPDSLAGGHSGSAVAISGSRVVVGRPGNATGASNAGSVYVYDLAGATPTMPVAILRNPEPAAGDIFGSSVAISGTRVVVGAAYDDTGAQDTGSAYVYDLAGATPTLPAVTLHNPSAGPVASFGSSVAISGSRVAVGIPLEVVAGSGNSGSVLVYDVADATPAVPLIRLQNPNPTERDYFGASVAISGARVIVGAFQAGRGNAYVYDLSSATPGAAVAILRNPAPAASFFFGFSVAIDGTVVAIGAPLDVAEATDLGSAYVYGPSPYSLWKVSELNDQFAADLGDGDGDGLSNLGEYGVLHSPTIPEGAPFSTASASYSEGQRLRMFVPRDPTRDDITLEVQATGDLLGPWTTIATSVLGAPFTGPGYFSGDSATPGVKSVEVRDTVNLTDAPRRFLRVRVQH